MSEIAIRVENLGKRYRIGSREPYKALRDTITDAMYAPFRAVASALNGRRSALGSQSSDEYIWALKDVSFEVRQGEVVGVIGRNGAGKTTLLKILSRITEPTEGYAEIHGRVGSLLEVGTGFHPELTGRENIYLNGAILGMKKTEIDQKFDEIIAFAEVEKFIDTPVKHYSSGMHMRLGFAVAAYLEPEILLVDEVLAVGDAAFQKKCLGKMSQIGDGGRTVLFVSHNLQAIRSLCKTCLLFQSGRLMFFGNPENCVDRYLSAFQGNQTVVMDTSGLPRPVKVDDLGKSLRITKVRLSSSSGAPVIRTGEPIKVHMELLCLEELSNVVFGIGIISLDGVRLVQYRSSDTMGFIHKVRPGDYSVSCTIDNFFASGNYTLELGARSEHKGLDWLPESLCFEIVDATPYESLWLESRAGYLKAVAGWEFSQLLQERGSN